MGLEQLTREKLRIIRDIGDGLDGARGDLRLREPLGLRRLQLLVCEIRLRLRCRELS